MTVYLPEKGLRREKEEKLQTQVELKNSLGATALITHYKKVHNYFTML